MTTSLWNIGKNPSATLLLFLVIFGFKISALVAYGPIHTPDSGGYSGHADIMLGDDQSWRSTVNLDDFWQPNTAFRILGYPAVVALAKLVSPQNWDWLLVIAQMGVSLAATLFIARLAYVWSRERTWIAYTTAIGHALGQGWVLDQCILTDSFHASLWVIVISVMALGSLERRPPSLRQVLALGVLIALAFSMREAGSVLQVLLWPILLYWSLSTGCGKARAFLTLIVFALPMFLGVEAYKSWNQLRTGERFITTGGQTAYFQPMLRLKERGLDVFAEDPLLFDMPALVEPISSIRPLSHIWVINNHLHEKHAMNAIEIAQYGKSAFFRLWREHPLDMIDATLSRLRKKQIILPLMPFDAYNDLRAWATNDQVYINSYNIWGAEEDFATPASITLLVLRTATRIFSSIIMATFVVGVPLLGIKHLVQAGGAIGRVSPSTWLMVLLWSGYMGYTLAYASVTLEPRYLMPVQPFSTIIGLMLLGQIAKNFMHFRPSRKLFSH